VPIRMTPSSRGDLRTTTSLRRRYARYALLVFIASGAASLAVSCAPSAEEPGSDSQSTVPRTDAELRADAQALVRDEETEARGHAILGRLSEGEGDLEQAARAYKRSLEADPLQPAVLHDLAVIQYAQGDLDEAVRTLRTALQMNPELHGSRLMLADVLAELGLTRDARSEYRYIIDAEPRNLDIGIVEARLEALK